MEIRDLRVGNYLFGKCIDDLDDRKEWWEIYQIQDAEDLKCITVDWDKPIELTEEILLKSGFKENKFSHIYEDDTRVSVYVNDGFFFCQIDNVVINNIKHLHQLQNLYWCLCGKELNVNM